MSEENNEKKEDNTLISDEELQKIEEQIKQKQAEEYKSRDEAKAKEIEEKVRKELLEKAEKEALQRKLKAQEEAIAALKKEQEEKSKAQAEVFEKRIQELEAQKKGAATNDNPFKKEDKIDPDTQRVLPDGKVINMNDPTIMAEIEEESRKAMIQHLGIPDNTWGKPRNR